MIRRHAAAAFNTRLVRMCRFLAAPAGMPASCCTVLLLVVHRGLMSPCCQHWPGHSHCSARARTERERGRRRCYVQRGILHHCCCIIFIMHDKLCSAPPTRFVWRVQGVDARPAHFNPRPLQAPNSSSITQSRCAGICRKRRVPAVLPHAGGGLLRVPVARVSVEELVTVEGLVSSLLGPTKPFPLFPCRFFLVLVGVVRVAGRGVVHCM